MRQKGFTPIIIIGIVFLLVVSFIVGRIFSSRNKFQANNTSVYATIKPGSAVMPTPIPKSTLKWQTYTNEKYHLEFEYPYTCSEIIDGKENELDIWTNNNQYLYCGDIGDVQIFLYIGTNDTNRQRFIREFGEAADNSLTEYFVIDGIKGTRRFLPRENHKYESDALLTKNGVSYYFQDASSDRSFLDKVLSTFKFTQ